MAVGMDKNMGGWLGGGMGGGMNGSMSGLLNEGIGVKMDGGWRDGCRD